MKAKDRFRSILETPQLYTDVTGIPSFKISRLKCDNNLDITLPDNLRLGHLVERCISELINQTQDIVLLHENVQLIEDKKRSENWISSLKI